MSLLSTSSCAGAIGGLVCTCTGVDGAQPFFFRFLSFGESRAGLAQLLVGSLVLVWCVLDCPWFCGQGVIQALGIAADTVEELAKGSGASQDILELHCKSFLETVQVCGLLAVIPTFSL